MANEEPIRRGDDEHRPGSNARTGEGAVNAHTPEGGNTEGTDLRGRMREGHEREQTEPTRITEAEGLKRLQNEGQQIGGRPPPATFPSTGPTGGGMGEGETKRASARFIHRRARQTATP